VPTNRSWLGRAAPVVAVLSLWTGAQSLPQPSSGAPLQRLETLTPETWLIPIDNMTRMRTAVFRPPGRGPFPLVVINHGSAENEDLRRTQQLPAFSAVSAWFVQRGFIVVIPQRPGHGETGGAYLETSGSCDDPDYIGAGLATAHSIQIALNFALAQNFVDKKRVMLAGHSAGAWGSLALASRNPPYLNAVINFAGGRGGHSYDLPNRNCAAERLVSAAGHFGKTTKIPTLWLYAENDTFFSPTLADHMVRAFQRAGGAAEFYKLPSFGEEGHYLLHSSQAMRTWALIVEKFLGKSFHSAVPSSN
jgi:dienelactone hydrolase